MIDFRYLFPPHSGGVWGGNFYFPPISEGYGGETEKPLPPHIGGEKRTPVPPQNAPQETHVPPKNTPQETPVPPKNAPQETPVPLKIRLKKRLSP